MANEQFESLIEAMPRIAEAVNAFESDALREKAMDSLMAAFGLRTAPPAPPPTPTPQVQNNTVDTEATPSGGNGGQRRTTRKPGSRRPAADLTIDKSISARPEGKEALVDFLARAQPKNHHERIVAIVYWLGQVGGYEPITRGKVLTGFRLAELRAPTDLANKISQTSSRGWLKDATSDNLELSVPGEEHLSYEMLKRPPKTPKAE